MDPSTLTAVRTVALREIWEHEEYDFTPWLVRHTDELGTAIGIEIENVSREHAVGGYSADIIGREVNTGGRVVIENQFGTTDHDHLGKLLTYAAGTDARFVIWVAESFREEHRAVLEWLNDSGPEGAKFFAVRPRVIVLGEDSRRGFEFSTVLEPNDWVDSLGADLDSLSEREHAYREFYRDLSDSYAENRSDWNKLKAQPQGWLAFGAGISGVQFAWSFHKGPEFAAELYISTSDKERNEEIYRHIQRDESEIEDELGDVVWELLPEKQACRIKRRTDVSGPIEMVGEHEWSELVEWGVSNMNDIRRAFELRLRSS